MITQKQTIPGGHNQPTGRYQRCQTRVTPVTLPPTSTVLTFPFVEALIHKVQRVVAELDEIRDALGAQERPAEPMDLELLSGFKASVDHMRHVLWAYIEALSTTGDVDRTLHQYRIQRATEMLRQLRAQGPFEVITAQDGNFLREVQAIAEDALERHGRGRG